MLTLNLIQGIQHPFGKRQILNRVQDDAYKTSAVDYLGLGCEGQGGGLLESSSGMNHRTAAEEFLKIAGQFRLGALATESPHPVTTDLSAVAGADTSEALRLLFEVDRDVVRKYAEWSVGESAQQMGRTLLDALTGGGRIIFTGCGSTGRLGILLESIWRTFWQNRGDRAWDDRVVSVMAGGDFALIKSVEGFEDFTRFGERQIEDAGVGPGDVVFAITEGGETSFVIGTAWKALELGAKVYFVYNNPDDVLRERIQRSREIIDEPRIEKINLTTGPMAVTGSTRMQATSIQLCVMLSVMETVARALTSHPGPESASREFLDALESAHETLTSPPVRRALAALVALEEDLYRSGRRNNYIADALAVDVLTDTAERSPTFCTPPFRRFDDALATESWSFLFLPRGTTDQAWNRLLKRDIRAVEWSESEVRDLVGTERADRVLETIRKIGPEEILKFRIGLDGLASRPLRRDDAMVAVLAGRESDALISPDGFARRRLEAAEAAGARVGLIYLGGTEQVDAVSAFLECWHVKCRRVLVALLRTGLLLDGVARVAAKMLLNALSTCTMVRLGRVMGNFMVYVVPSNLKLIDRASRYIEKLTGLDYQDACRLLFEVIEYVEPRTKSDQAYPPVVGLAVTRAKLGISNEQAERHLAAEQH